VSIIIRRYTEHKKFAAYMAVPFITFFHILGSVLYSFIYGCMFCMLIFCKLCILIVIFMYSYCYVRSVLGILFHCTVLCIVCV